MEPDFTGVATKANIKCSDGRTIMPDAFAHQDQVKVPLVWMHDHDTPENVLGHAILKKHDGDMLVDCYFNSSPQGVAAKAIVEHGDVDSLSIWANKLVERAKQVFHGAIREVSLVLSGANPGAKINFVNIRHADGSVEEFDDEAIIFSGEPIKYDNLSHGDDENSETEESEETETTEVEEEGSDNTESSETTETEESDSDKEIEHAEFLSNPEVRKVYDTFTPDQKDFVHYMLAEALLTASDDSSAEHSNNDEGNLAHKEGNDAMTGTRNIFEGSDTQDDSKRLTHSQLVDIVEKAKKNGGHFKDALLAHAEEYGITDIDMLFPDAKALTQSPEFISRRMEWVSSVLGGTKHSPFAKVKTLFADITEDEARAKGYIKGTRKKEEVFTLLQRTTGPATIYKKQKLDRDDILDITDFDVVNWLKAEMRLMIEEELARAILVGDGRAVNDPDKVKDPSGSVDGVGIRSILNDDDLYVIKRELAANVTAKDAVKGIIRATDDYRGSGVPVMYTSRSNLTEMLLDEDKFGRPLYADKKALADKLGVKDIIPVDVFTEYDGLFAIIVSLQDYTVGSNKGGELTSFEDFDIDFNQHKYLQETRLSGGLTKPFSAIVITRAQGTSVTPTGPSFDGETNTITIPTVAGVTYTIDGDEVTGDVEITEVTEVRANADEGYYFPTGTTREWTFTPTEV